MGLSSILLRLGISKVKISPAAVQNLYLSMCLDTGHANCKSNFPHVVSGLSGQLALVHANDNLATHDDHLPPGEGNIDWSMVLKMLWASGFNGVLMLELAGDTGETQSEMLSKAVRARHYLNKKIPCGSRWFSE